MPLKSMEAKIGRRLLKSFQEELTYNVFTDGRKSLIQVLSKDHGQRKKTKWSYI